MQPPKIEYESDVGNGCGRQEDEVHGRNESRRKTELAYLMQSSVLISRKYHTDDANADVLR